MHLLYVDESGSVDDTEQRFFVLAGFSVFEHELRWLEQDLDKIAIRFDAHQPELIELHGSPMRSGKGRWRRVPREDRERAISDTLVTGIRQRFPGNIRFFAAILEKSRFSGRNVVQVAFEQVCSRFDQYLGRLHRNGDTQRGLIVFDKCATERRLRTLAPEFKTSGHTFVVTCNLAEAPVAEAPVFVDSEATRLIQLADLVAYSIFRHFEYQGSKFFHLISHCFDSEGGVTHGLFYREKSL